MREESQHHNADDEAQPTELHKHQDHGLTEQAPVPGGVHDDQAGDSYGRRGGEECGQEVASPLLTARGHQEQTGTDDNK